MSVDKIIQVNVFDKLTANRTHRRALLLAMVAIAAIGLYRWILAPYGNQLLAAEKYNFALGSMLHKTSVLGKTLEAKKAKLEELTSASARQRNQLLTPGEVRAFFASLSAIAGRTGCVIQSVSLPSTQQDASRNQAGDGSGITGKKATLSIVGGYGNIVAFLEELQDYRHKVWVDSMRMETGNAGKLKCQIMLTIYCDDNREMASYE